MTSDVRGIPNADPMPSDVRTVGSRRRHARAAAAAAAPPAHARRAPAGAPGGPPRSLGAGMRVQPLARSLNVGAIVTGIDLRAACMTDSLWSAVRDAFAQFHFLHFPRQSALQPSDQVHFAQQFPHDEEYVKTMSGPIQSPFSLVTLPNHPLVMAQGNVLLEDHYGLTTQLAAADLAVESGLEWHTDNIDSPTQSVLTSLHCLAAPQSGGETMFAGGPGVFAALSEAQQAFATNLVVRYTRWDATNSRRQADGLSKIQAMMLPDGTRLAYEAPHPVVDDTITAEHPLVRWTHRGSQAQASIATTPSLLHSLQCTATGKVLGFEESRDTLAALLRPGTTTATGSGDEDDASANQAWAHRWRKGDFVAWDNRWMIHSTTSPRFWVGDRLMHRVRLPAPAG